MEKITDEKELIDLLLHKDELALTKLYSTYADDIFDYFIIKYPTFRYDTSQLADLITDALLKLVKCPEKYNSVKSSLKSFIILDINGNVLNFLSKLNNKKNTLTRTVELNINDGNIEQQEMIGEEINYENLTVELKSFFAREFEDERDQILAWMIKIERVRETKKFGAILSILDRDQQLQEEIVKRHKDRINAKLKRSGFEDFLKQLQNNV